LWNFVLVHGNGNFYEHWFYSTDIDMLNPANRADGIVDSDLYTDILLSMIVAGISTSVKRTILALYLGKRVYIHYKPKLEKVMIDMLLLTEVAELANALGDFEGEKVDSPHALVARQSSSQLLTNPNKSTMVEFVQSHKKKELETSDEEGGQSGGLERPEPIQSWNRLRSLSNSDMEDNDLSVSNSIADKVLAAQKESLTPMAKKQSVESDLGNKTSEEDQSDKGSEQLCGIGIDDGDEGNACGDFFAEHSTDDLSAAHNYETRVDESEPPFDTVNEPVRNVLHEASTTSQIRSLLDRWEEPPNKVSLFQHSWELCNIHVLANCILIPVLIHASLIEVPTLQSTKYCNSEKP
jgi:hypothetical protein